MNQSQRSEGPDFAGPCRPSMKAALYLKGSGQSRRGSKQGRDGLIFAFKKFSLVG